MQSVANNPLLHVDDLRVAFHTREGIARAVNGVSYHVARGETLGIVGESGSGKSVLQYALLGLLPTPPARIEGGRATFDGQALVGAPPRALRALRGKRIAMIFQDPMTALNPYQRIGAQLTEPLRLHEGTPRGEAWRRGIAILESVGITEAERRMRMYPHEFSGGMRQRVMIAMAIICGPDLLIADEPTTALDVTVQAQILALIKERQEAQGMAVVLITHDLGVVAETCDRVHVMYAGRFMEAAAARPLFHNPRHPYTRALMAALPAEHTADDLYTIPGLPPDLTALPPGCPFAPRCAHAAPLCTEDPCALKEVDAAHASACVREQRGELPQPETAAQA